jgi:hypothetical protein
VKVPKLGEVKFRHSGNKKGKLDFFLVAGANLKSIKNVGQGVSSLCYKVCEGIIPNNEAIEQVYFPKAKKHNPLKSRFLIIFSA